MSEKDFMLKFFYLTNIYMSYSSYTFALNYRHFQLSKELKERTTEGGENHSLGELCAWWAWIGSLSFVLCLL